MYLHCSYLSWIVQSIKWLNKLTLISNTKTWVAFSPWTTDEVWWQFCPFLLRPDRWGHLVPLDIAQTNRRQSSIHSCWWTCPARGEYKLKGVGWIPKKLPCENRCVFWKAFSVRSLYAPAGGGWGANKPTTRERLRKRCQGFHIVPWARGSPWAENQVFDLVFFASLFCSSYLFREVLRYSYF